MLQLFQLILQVKGQTMLGFDLEILKWFESLRSGFANSFFEYVTMLGEEALMILLVAVLWFAFDKRIAQRLFFITVVSLSFNSIIKNFAKVERPFATGEVTCVRPDTATGYSFPSGHTQNFATWSTASAIKFKKTWFSVLSGVLISLVALSRVFLGAHYPSDVIAGALLGVVFAFIGSTVYDKAVNKMCLFKGAFLLLTPFALFFILSPDTHYADFYKLYGMLAGLIAAVGFEEKFAPLDYTVCAYKKILRVVVGVVLALAVKEGLKVFNAFEVLQLSLAFDAMRYFVVVFICLGLCPLLFKKIKI